MTTPPLADTSRPTWCEVDLAALVANYRTICAHAPGAHVVPVLKANAYGHGANECGLALQQAGATTLAVAYVEEGVALREAGVTTDIHVLGGAVERQIPLFFSNDLTFTAPSVTKLHQIDSAAAAAGITARAHLKIDTGMERIGVHHYNAPQLFQAAQQCPNVTVKGVFSHFACADEPACPTTGQLRNTTEQLRRFDAALGWFEANGVPRPPAHIANSAATIRLPESHLDAVRVGIALYGVGPFAHQLNLRPVLSWHSEVIYFKVVPAGTPVSYGGTWAPVTDTRVVTLPVGYADGYPIAASPTAGEPRRAEVLLNGCRRSVAGRVCMDQTMVDLGDGTAYNGDQVTLVGTQTTANGERLEITVDQLAGWVGTSPYELLTRITSRVPRRYVNRADTGQHA